MLEIVGTYLKEKFQVIQSDTKLDPRLFRGHNQTFEKVTVVMIEKEEQSCLENYPT